MHLQINHRGEGKIELLMPEKVDITNYREFKENLLTLIDEGNTSFTLDFTNAQKVDTAGLGCLLSFRKILNDKQGKLKIINIKSNYIKNMFDSIHLYKVIDYKDENE